jgi:hypothetical protein
MHHHCLIDTAEIRGHRVTPVIDTQQPRVQRQQSGSAHPRAIKLSAMTGETRIGRVFDADELL